MRQRIRTRLRGGGQGPWILIAAIAVALLVTPFAIAAGEGRPLRAASATRRRTSPQSLTRETQIIASNRTYGTRQSNKSDNGGGAIYGCRSAPAARRRGNEPCIRASNLDRRPRVRVRHRAAPRSAVIRVGQRRRRAVHHERDRRGHRAERRPGRRPARADEIVEQRAADEGRRVTPTGALGGKRGVGARRAPGGAGTYSVVFGARRARPARSARPSRRRGSDAGAARSSSPPTRARCGPHAPGGGGNAAADRAVPPRRDLLERATPVAGQGASRPRRSRVARRGASPQYRPVGHPAEWPSGPVTTTAAKRAVAGGRVWRTILTLSSAAMATAVKTTVTELPESRVRVEAEVAAEESQRSLERRPREARARDEAARLSQGQDPAGGRHPAHRPRADPRRGGPRPARRAGTSRPSTTPASHPVGDPDVDLGDLPDEGKPLTFSFEIGVRPTATLGDVPRPRGRRAASRPPTPRPSTTRSRRCASACARLETVDEPAGERRLRVIDFVGTVDGEPFEGGEGRDQLVELGAGRLIPGFEEHLDRRRGRRGAHGRRRRSPTTTAPSTSPARTPQFAVTVKEVKRKHLPELDDDFAADAAGFDTLEELREDIAERAARGRRAARRGRVPRGRARRRRRARRRSTSPSALVEARASELWTACCTRSATRASRRRPTCRSPARPRTS